MLAEVTAAHAHTPSDVEPDPPELLVILNPGSGALDADGKREVLSRVFGQAMRRFRILPVAGPEDLESACARAAQQALDTGAVLVAVGGDGTINTVAQAAWTAGCPLGVLPQGTFNLFGRDHGIAQDLEVSARALLNAQPTPVQVGEVNGHLFLVNASLGLYPQLLEDRETFKNQFGRHRWVAAISGLVTLFKWRRQLTVEIEADGERTQLTTPTLFIGNNRLQLQRIGIDPVVTERVGQGRLAALIAKPIGTGSMLWLMLRGAFGRLGDPEQLLSFPFESLTVRVRRRRMKVAVDGEVGTMSPPLRFAVAARPLMLMMPRPEDRVAVE